MIDVDLPDGPGSPLVRGFAACLSSVTETPLADLPALTGDEPLTHALGSWKSWLAGRGAGLVPIADPRSFQWAGWWIAVVDGSDSPLTDGPQRRVAALAFGTPPGIVLSPQDRGLLGRATADLPISSAFAVASLDPVLRQLPELAALSGRVQQIAIAPHAEAPMQLVASGRALAGRGLEGDRYASNAGTFSVRGGHRPGYELTLSAQRSSRSSPPATRAWTSPAPGATSSPAASTSTHSSGETSASATSAAAACGSPSPAPTSSGSPGRACCDR